MLFSTYVIFSFHAAIFVSPPPLFRYAIFFLDAAFRYCFACYAAMLLLLMLFRFDFDVMLSLPLLPSPPIAACRLHFFRFSARHISPALFRYVFR